MSGEEKNMRDEVPEAKVKVTDKRMFGPNGELREEYRFLDETGEEPGGAAAPRETAAAEQTSAPPTPPAEPTPAEPPPPRQAPVAQPSSAAGEPAGEPEAASGRPLEIPTGPAGPGTPSFLDLLSLLAEPVAIYLGDVELPDGKSAENLEMARLHIDLLDVLRSKTVGNLTAQESAAMENVLYSLRVRYVQKRG